MLPKNPKVDLRRTFQRVFEISIILSVSYLIAALKFFPKIEIERV